MSRRGHRFYVPTSLDVGASLALPEQTARQIANVLRLKPGDEIRLFSGDGSEVTAEITDVNRGDVTVRLTRRVSGMPCLAPPRMIGLALMKHDRFEWALQKLTELGVDRVVPMTTERTVLSFRVDRSAQRFARWQRIITEAAEQSGRSVLPQIEPVAEFVDVLANYPDARAIILWEGEQTVGLPQLLDDRPTLLLIGPEGGFSTAEIELARARDVETASLGPLILRAETAAIAAASMMLAHRMSKTLYSCLEDIRGHDS